MKRNLTGFILAVLIASPSLGAVEANQTLDVAKSKPQVEFLAVGNPSALKIHGRAKDDNAVTGKLTLNGSNVTGKVNVAVTSLDTGIDMRNRHMKEKYLEVSKFPTSEFSLVELKLPATGDVSAKAVPFKGELTLHGITKPVAGVADVEKHGKEVALKFEFKVNTDDFKITTPSFMGITMAREVTVDANFEGPVL